MTFFRGLQARVLVVLALATVVPTVLVGALAVWRARTNVEAEVVNGRLALVRALGAGLDQTLQDTQRALSLTGAAWAEQQDPGSTRRLLGRLRRELPIVRRVAVLGTGGKPLAGDPVPLESFSGAGGFGGFVGEAAFAGEPSVVIWAQARGRTGELYGYLAAEIDLSFVAASLRGARLPEGAVLYVVEASGKTIASSDPDIASGSRAGSRAAIAAALATADDGSLEDGNQLAVYRNLSSFQTTRGIGWAILLEQPLSGAYALSAKTRRDTLLAGGAVLVLAAAAGLWIARRLARPLVSLSQRVDALGAGEQQPLPADLTGAPGEIGLLARRFDEMGKRLEERERLRQALARGERLATVGALAAGVAHEINNPLTTILGYANLVLEDKPADHRDRPGLELVAEEARRVQGIVRDLLDYSRADPAGRMSTPVDLGKVAARAAALTGPTLRTRRVTLTVEVPADLPRPAGDARRLEQVFVNLAQNAAQAMDAGGELKIRALVRDAWLAVEFVDQGPGMSPEVLARVFEPFFTTKGIGIGTGLGLAVAQQIVIDHGGRIEVESQPGQGSTFRLLLPLPSASGDLP